MEEAMEEAIEEKDLERIRRLVVKYGLSENMSREKVRTFYFSLNIFGKRSARAESMFAERKIVVFDIECKVTYRR